MTHRNFPLSLFTAALPLFLSCTPLFAASLEDLHIIKIASADHTAVVTLDDDMRVLKVGDRIHENSTVREITEGRVVLGVKTEVGIETVIYRMEDGKQSIQRIRKTNQKVPTLVAPMIKE